MTASGNGHCGQTGSEKRDRGGFCAVLLLVVASLGPNATKPTDSRRENGWSILEISPLDDSVAQSQDLGQQAERWNG
ncbi:hypothetical protein BaRGS_00014617, partial [Batillaria attramentaria]